MKYYFSLLFLSLLILSCNKNEDLRTDSEWLIPSEEVLDGGPGIDGIPSVDNPEFESVNEINYLENQDLVVGIIHNGQAKAYPHPILDWHEIVNDELQDITYALTYCPLTGTAIAWNRNLNGTVTTFGVSGKLYNANLIPYDRDSDSYWSQLELKCVNGPRIGFEIETFPIVETTWVTWKKMYPNSQIMNTNTGFSRNYNSYPYGDYRTNDDNILFPLNPLDSRLPSKKRVLGILSDNVDRVYPLDLFQNDRVIKDILDGTEVVILGSKSDNYIVAYEKGPIGDLEMVKNEYPVIAEDEEGNKVTLSGLIIEGPLNGTQLKTTHSFMGYWMAFGAFYPGIEIYE